MWKKTPMPNVLLEIGLEEVPARFVTPCLNRLLDELKKEVQSSRLSHNKTQFSSHGTYRRFTFLIQNIHAMQPDISDVVLGPPLSAARSDTGEWLAPAIGFAKKYQVSVDHLTIAQNQKGQAVISARLFEKGQSALAILPRIFQAAVSEMPCPIAMRWGENHGPFIRPIQWICAMLDNQVIDWTFMGVSSGRLSQGHRFLTSPVGEGNRITISSPEHYIDELNSAFVMVDYNQRRQVIRSQLQGADPIDESLLNEVVQLVEWPQVLPITFPKKFLKLPNEVLVACLKKHQKAFMVFKNGHISNSCLVVADSVTAQNQSQISLGNQRVMMARLNDVEFFWTEDLTNSGFEPWQEALKNVVFQKNMGNMFDKITRMKSLANYLMATSATQGDKHVVNDAIYYSKADLMSSMVVELPSLQGIMGGHYARAFGLNNAVAVAIRDHYNPRFDGDVLPETVEGAIVSIVDRLDTIVASFENGAIPTGSRDPWGIRRSMMAIMKMIIHFKLPINLTDLLMKATKEVHKTVGETTQKCRQFFEKRIETVLADHGIPTDVIQWVLPHVMDEPLVCFVRAKAFTSTRATSPDIVDVWISSANRVSNMMPNAVPGVVVDQSLFEYGIENQAWASFQELKKISWELTPTHTDAVTQFCHLLSIYFDEVLVFSQEAPLTANRCAFMRSVNQYFSMAGEWSMLKK
jgi:glycyl-tRNA synthetase beta chain